MPDRIGRFFTSMGKGSIAIFDKPQALDKKEGFSTIYTGNSSRQEGLRSQIIASKWLYNPTEGTHKDIPYPFRG